MGWTGIYKQYKTNLDNIKYDVHRGKTEEENLYYKGFTQRGSSVYVLYQKKRDMKYFVICYLCQTTHCHGYSEFMYKDIDAVSNHCFDFPKKWVDLLDKDDKEVQEYIAARNAYEQKKKTEHKLKLGDMFLCKSHFDINWGSYSIKKGEEFYIKYHNHYGHKYFLLCNKDGQVYYQRLMRKTFYSLDKTFIKNIG